MGLHTAEPAVGPDRYVGLGVHRAARICSAGHGGQILVSNTTRELIEDDLPAGVVLRDLGEHRLKDLDRPERIHQLAVEGLPSEFAPLKTVDAQPVEATPFAGREGELAEAATAAVAPRPRLRQRRTLALAGVVLAGAIAVGSFFLAGGTGGAGAVSVRPNAVGVVSAKRDRLVAAVPVGASPSGVAVGDGSVWVTNADDHTVARIDPVTRQVRQTIPVGSAPTGIAFGDGAVWVANNLDGTVSRIDPQLDRVVLNIVVGTAPTGVAFGEGAVWVANSQDGTVTKIDPQRGVPVGVVRVGATVSDVAVGAGAVWASDGPAAKVARIDPATKNIEARIPVGNGAAGLALGNGLLWVANSLDGTVSAIDPTTNAVKRTDPVGSGPTGVAAAHDTVWVSNELAGTVSRIDMRTNEVRFVKVGNRPGGVAVVGSSVWITVRASGTAHRGGTLVLRAPHGGTPLDRIDTAVAFGSLSWPDVLINTNDGLVGFKRVGGSEGATLVPDLAVSLPAPVRRGKSYTFRIRTGIRYSNGARVRASDFRRALERVFALNSQGSGFYAAIAGAATCMRRPRRCDLSRGIVADDAANTVTFHLTRPDPDFLYKLALPFADAVPAGTAAKERVRRPLPATGPYMIEKYEPERLLTLVRNPRFHEWSRAAQPNGYPDRIEFGGTDEAAVTAVEHGEADWVGSNAVPIPSDRLRELSSRFATQLHRDPQATLVAYFLNTHVAPFDDLRVRQAVNYAVDRGAVVRLSGGANVLQPTCQVLPPNFPGYRRYCPYTVAPSATGRWLAPDPAKAKRLVAASGTKGMKVVVYGTGYYAGAARYAVRLLDRLGYRASVRFLASGPFFAKIGDSRNRVQIGMLYWLADYPSPSDFINQLLSCGSFRRADPTNQNPSGFCSRDVDTGIARAFKLRLSNPQAANAQWARLDHRIVDLAPWVPLFNARWNDFVSKRVGNFQFSPEWTALVDQLWVR
jgi:YVTN family beta-propeller protein